MRISYRPHGGNRAYWQRRWDGVPADRGALNIEKYPGRYAEAVMNRVQGRVLEAGCGAGRVLLHYHRRGRDIIGIDFIATALASIRKQNDDVALAAADITQLPFSSGSFEAVLAFGLYHNLERGIVEALRETRRILSNDGILCASIRSDNLQNRIVDYLATRGRSREGAVFHKANFSLADISKLFSAAGFSIEKLEFVENMPFLYKFATFRHPDHKIFDEHKARSEGYRLSAFGGLLQRTLVRLWPGSFCNIFVVTARCA